MSKNVAVFVDVANIFYAAKAAGVDIDYVTLLKAAVAGRDFVRAYAYTGLDPENENQRNFHAFLARHGYKVVSKDIRKYGDGKVKANLDIELVVDMMKTARNLDVAIVVSGDGDFAPAIRAVQEMGVRVEVISFRGNTSSDLMDVADLFTDITQIAKVDKESSRSGRRVSGAEDDLSMTEVPDKQTEGRSSRRGRGRDRGGRAEAAEEAPAGASRGGGRRTGARSGGRLVALPGEKLSRATAAEGGEPAEGEAASGAAAELDEGAEGEAAEGGPETTGRRRRRRGGRGRGRGRSHAPGEFAEGEVFAAEEGEAADSPAVRPNQFGSVWDSQIGMDTQPTRLAPISGDEDDYAEPEIPEYLLAERRRGSGRGGRGGGGRGARSAYASAVERERYGRSAPRYSEPMRQPQQRRRDERPARGPQPQQHRGGGMPRGERASAEPWSEVPPEIEELLRAQLSTKLARPAGEAPAAEAGEAPAAEAPAGKARAATRGRRKAAEAGEGEAPAGEAPAGEAPAKAKAATRGRRKAAEAGEGAETAAPKKRAPARRKTAAAAEAIAGGSDADGSEGRGEASPGGFGEGGEPAGW